MLRAHVDLRAPAPPPAPRGRAPLPSPRATCSIGAVPETKEEQDIAIGAVADAEAEEEIDFASDSSDDDYHLPILDLPSRQHDHEVGGSSSATDPTLLAILEGMRADQQRAAEEQARRDRAQAAVNVARQDEAPTTASDLLGAAVGLSGLVDSSDLMATTGIQLPQVQLPGTSTVRPLTPVLQPSGLQSQPFTTPQHLVS